MEPRSGSVRRETTQRLKLTAEDLEDKQKLLDEKARDSLQFCHDALCSHMNPDGVRRILFTCNVLTTDEKEEAQRSDLIKSQKSEKLVDSVRQRGWRDIIKFAAILIATNQEDLAADLMQTLKQQLEEHSIDVREEVDQAKEKILKLHQKVSPAHNKPDYTYYLSELDKEHADLQEAVYCVLRKADSEQLSTRLISLLTSYKDRALACEDIDSAIKSLQKCFEKEPPKNVFMYVTPFMDKLDVRLLEGLIKFASKENSSSAKYAREQKIDLDQQLDEYKSKVTSACEKTLELCPRQPANKQPKNGLLVAMQTYLPEHDVTITKICRLKKYLRDDLGMEETVFEGFSCSNVTLFFSVSKDRLPFLVHWCCLHRRDLMEKFGVELVFSPGHFVYNLYADQEYPYPQAVLSQPQPAVPEKEPVDVLSEIKENLTATLQDAIWNWQIAFERKNDEWRAELHGKIGEVQQAILSERECKEVKLTEETRDKGGLAKELGKPIEEYKWKLKDAELLICRDELQKCRNELKTTTTERDWLSQRIAMQQNMDQHFHKLQEQMKRKLVEIVAKVIANVHKISAGVSELSKEVQQSPDQTSSTSSVQQSLTAPAPVSKNLTEDGTRRGEIFNMSEPQTGAPNIPVSETFTEEGTFPEEMLSVSKPPSSLTGQSSTGEPHAQMETELVSRAAELQKCRDELKTTTAERDRLRHTIAMKQYMDLRFHRLQEQMTRDLVQIVAKVIAGVHEVSAGVSELDKGVQELQDQTSSTSVQQSLTDPAPVSKNLTEDGTRTGEILCMSQPLSSLRRQSSTGEPNALVKYQPEGAKGASGQCSLPGSAMDYWQGRDSHARSTGQTSRTPLLQDPVEFMKSFMDGCKKEFLQHVTAKPIAAKLESDNLISSNVKKGIDDAADIESGTLLLFKHFRTQCIPGSIPLFCQIMEESSGNSLMNTFAKAMREKFAHRLFLNQSN